jgi:hypothetical protein
MTARLTPRDDSGVTRYPMAVSFEQVGVADVAYMFDLVFDPTNAFEPNDLLWIGPRTVRDEAGLSCRLLEYPGVHDAPLGQRAILYWLVMSSETRRNGIDGFVWNARPHLRPIFEVFRAIGARGAVAELAELAAVCVQADDDADDDLDVAHALLEFRALARGPFIEAGAAVSDVEDALRAFAALQPTAFVDLDAPGGASV